MLPDPTSGQIQIKVHLEFVVMDANSLVKIIKFYFLSCFQHMQIRTHVVPCRAIVRAVWDITSMLLFWCYPTEKYWKRFSVFKARLLWQLDRQSIFIHVCDTMWEEKPFFFLLVSSSLCTCIHFQTFKHI